MVTVLVVAMSGSVVWFCVKSGVAFKTVTLRPMKFCVKRRLVVPSIKTPCGAKPVPTSSVMMAG